MGIDIHALQLLKHNQKTNGKLGRTITLGRLSVLLGPKLAKKWVGTDQGAWCEDLLMRHFGATEVDSIDNSHYEGAKIIFDYNQPVPKELHQQYDAVIDFGCSEHIFNVAQVFKNTADICKIGGRILHILPADNFCGHGFYQFTPEFFLSIYSNKNGYRGTEIFLSDLYKYKEWHKESKPEGGERINIKTRNETYILVITKKNSEVALKAQQSDYQHIWNESQSAQAKPHKPGRLMALQEFFKFSPSAIKTIVAINNFFSTNGPKKLCSNRHLSKHKPDEI